MRAVVTDTMMRSPEIAAALARRDARRRRLIDRRCRAALSIIPIAGIGEIRPGDELAVLIARRGRRAGHAARRPRLPRRHAEDRVEGRGPARPARSRRPRRAPRGSSSRSRCASCAARGDLIISETRHGFVCANAGHRPLERRRRAGPRCCPVDSDRSAKHVRDALRARRGVDVAVIVSDTFGRPWRQGLTDVAIGVSGIAAVVDLRDTPDALGRIAAGHRGRDRRRDRVGAPSS